MEEIITLGIPYTDSDNNGFIPVIINSNTIAQGGSIEVDGTIPDTVGTGLNGLGRVFSQNSGKDLRIPIHTFRGVYTYKITERDSTDLVISESTGEINIPSDI